MPRLLAAKYQFEFPGPAPYTDGVVHDQSEHHWLVVKVNIYKVVLVQQRMVSQLEGSQYGLFERDPLSGAKQAAVVALGAHAGADGVLQCNQVRLVVYLHNHGWTHTSL